METDGGEQVSTGMTLALFESGALMWTQQLLRHSGSLFCDSVFEASAEQDPIVDVCFNPARAHGDHTLHQATIIVAPDTNYLMRMEEILEKSPGDGLSAHEERVLATIALSALCDAKITPGFALAEMFHGTAGEYQGLHKAYRAYRYLCVDCDVEDIFEAVISGRVPNWSVSVSESVSAPVAQVEEIAQNRKFKATYFVCLCAGIVERRFRETRTHDEKLEMLFERILKEGAFVSGALRYMSLYFSDQASRFGKPRRSLLKGIHSNSYEKALAGIRNAARDCYLAAEFSSRMNDFHKRRSPTVFVTEDRLLQYFLNHENQDRQAETADIAQSLRTLRGGALPVSVERMLSEVVQYVPVDAAEKARGAPLRKSAQDFLSHPEPILSGALEEFRSLF
ncbi:MAG: hypothetical protein EP336_12800 [Rhodobacteraceae bacterium]|nr:MAG: hypothetical protein EP336_12800 [Paracoccaceae bacterium]